MGCCGCYALDGNRGFKAAKNVDDERCVLLGGDASGKVKTLGVFGPLCSHGGIAIYLQLVKFNTLYIKRVYLLGVADNLLSRLVGKSEYKVRTALDVALSCEGYCLACLCEGMAAVDMAKSTLYG